MRLCKNILALMAGGLVLTGCVTIQPRVSPPNTVEDWYGYVGGTSPETNGSKAGISFIDDAGGRTAKLSYAIPQGGWAGVWQGLSPNTPMDLSMARTFSFKMKSNLPGDLSFCVQDAHQVWYYTVLKMPTGGLTDVTVPVSDLQRGPGQATGQPMDLKQSPAISFNIASPGKFELMAGAITFGTVDPYLSLYPEALQKYRSAGGKLVLPEDARKYFVQAESAVGDKNYGGAVNFYYKGLAVAAWYPKAHYNLAILLAEHQNNYSEAVEEMKKYLELDPNAPDARAAQDKIYVWESKVQ